jgi:hypothetical protein
MALAGVNCRLGRSEERVLLELAAWGTHGHGWMASSGQAMIDDCGGN